VCGWQKMTSVWFSVQLCNNLRFSAWFQFYETDCGFGFSIQSLHCVLFNMYSLYWVLSSLLFTELVQLIVSRSDSELEVQMYAMAWRKMVWLLIQSCWKMNCEWDSVKNCLQTTDVVSWNRTAETEFLVFEFWGEFGLVRFLENKQTGIQHVHQVPQSPHPL